MNKPNTKPQAGPKTEKNFYPRMTADECFNAMRRSHSAGGSGNDGFHASFLELMKTPNGRLFGTLVIATPKPINGFLRDAYFKNFREALSKNGSAMVKDAANADKETIQAMLDAARSNTLGMTSKTPVKPQATPVKTASGPKTTGGHSPKPKAKKPARKVAKAKVGNTGTTSGPGGNAAKAKARAKSAAAKRGAAKAKAKKKSNGAKSNAAKVVAGKRPAPKSNARPANSNGKRPAPPPPALPPETQASLNARHQSELRALGLDGHGAVAGNISQYPVDVLGEVGGYKFGSGIDASYGDPRQSPLSGLQPGVTLGGSSALSDLYPGTAGSVGGSTPVDGGVIGAPPMRNNGGNGADDDMSHDFEAAWRRFKDSVGTQTANTAAGAPLAQGDLQAYASPGLYP